MRAGVLVAGGRSTRFGDADKAVASLAGVPMIRRVADRLVDAVDELVVNCRADQRSVIEDAMADYPLAVRYALDTDPDQGPVAGIEIALRAVADGVGPAAGGGDANTDRHRADDPYAFVVACDMPFVDAEFVDYLFDRARGHDAAIPRADGWFQTTHAVYRAGAMADACARALERGERRIVAPLFDLDYVVVGEDEIGTRADSTTFENVNTREEFEAVAERLE